MSEVVEMRCWVRWVIPSDSLNDAVRRRWDFWPSPDAEEVEGVGDSGESEERKT